MLILSEDIIVLLSRRGNRIMVNEHELITHLEAQFKLPVVVVSNEEHNFEDQVNIIKDAKVVVGMHGSILAMIMFCKRGTVIIEMYPFAVPSSNYTPYKILSEMDGMNFNIQSMGGTLTTYILTARI
jgi:protein O-mannose beta-1,4-N-acetylglucosaminyltransferase